MHVQCCVVKGICQSCSQKFTPLDEMQNTPKISFGASPRTSLKLGPKFRLLYETSPRFITLLDLDVDCLITWKTDKLSILHNSLEFVNWLCHTMRETTTGKSSKVISLIMLCFAQEVGQDPCVHFLLK